MSFKWGEGGSIMTIENKFNYSKNSQLIEFKFKLMNALYQKIHSISIAFYAKSWSTPSHCSPALKRISYETTTDAPVHTECGRIESAEFSTTIYSSSSFLNKITITFTKLSFPFLKCFFHPIYRPLLCTPWSVALFPPKRWNDDNWRRKSETKSIKIFSHSPTESSLSSAPVVVFRYLF